MKIYNTKPTFLYSPKMSPKVRKYSLESREVSFGRLLTVWFPTYSVRSRTRSHLLCSDTQRTQVTFMLCRSRKCCLCHLSRRCQAGRMNNKTSKWSAFFKIQITMTKNVMHGSELQLSYKNLFFKEYVGIHQKQTNKQKILRVNLLLFFFQVGFIFTKSTMFNLSAPVIRLSEAAYTVHI